MKESDLQALATHRDATVRKLPGLNPLSQTAETGAMGEYYDIQETIAPALVSTASIGHRANPGMRLGQLEAVGRQAPP